ncbi:hypothetical protein NIES4071_109140 (plasmid) [Calothrix sp. NIES-4071]|nr:hypothetical protein NIES4071_109140 [Calothrix sp. NIES-4071]BAZ65177.1 hypothetical protein NIES4105_109100 [Calothrix sp. NIES-4105]
MDINQQKEQFSNAYIQALASAAGYSLYKPFVDNDSVDWGIASKGTEGIVRAPRLELQLKSTSRDVLDDSAIRYPLKLKNYNDLILDGYSSPRILVVVIIPDNPTDWLQQSFEEICLRQCGYWVSLRGMAPTTNTTNVTVTIPITNQFTVPVLQSIMLDISTGGKP